MLGRSKKRKPSKIDSLIGHQSRVVGDIRFGGGLHVDGQIKGNVASDGDDKATLTVSDRGAIEVAANDNYTCARFADRTVTTAGATFDTTSAYDCTAGPAAFTVSVRKAVEVVRAPGPCA